ncbi:MAG: hypothetical protein L0332_00075, partial [Chloroflexi bacterium]|nr:hypothetical protein [Chloroflexota bacterium]
MAIEGQGTTPNTLLHFPRDLSRLLYWLYFKPFTLRRYVQAIDSRLNERLLLWEAADRLAGAPALHHLHRLVLALLVVGPLSGALLWGLTLRLTLLPLLGEALDWVILLATAGGYSAGALASYLLHWRVRRGDLAGYLLALPAAILAWLLLAMAGVPSDVAVGVAVGVA